MARRNVAAAANGGTASAQTALTGYAASGAINGDRTMTGWGSNGGWASDNAIGGLPQWWRVDFSGPMLIDEVDVITQGSPTPPTLTTPIDASFGSTAFTIEYWDGAAWQLVTTVTGSTFVWRQFTYTPFVTTAIRVTVTFGANGGDTTARLIEVEAWGDDDTGPPTEARVTRVVRMVLGDAGDTPEARVTRLARTVLGPGGIGEARVTRVRRIVLGPPREAIFENATLTIGLTWLELTRPSEMP